MRFGRTLVRWMLLWNVLNALGLREPRPLEALTGSAQAGLSSNRLERVRRTLRAHVDEGRLAGAVCVVARNDDVALLESFGYLELETRRPMVDDALFRIASMTKVFTSVAAMSLVEEGRLLLADPVAKYLPSFQPRAVGLFDEEGVLTGTRELEREITILDLLRHTSGITYTSPKGLGELYREHGLRSGELTAEQFIERLAALPLAEEPGTRFRYGLSIDVLGRVLEVLTAQPLDELLNDRIFTPLGMSDTAFVVPKEKLPRLTPIYRAENGALQLYEDPERSPLLAPPKAYSGGGGWGSTGSLGGAVSTARDLLQFYRMLLNRGELEGVRILSRKSVELMTVDHLDGVPGAAPGTGFGLGFAVVTDLGRRHQAGSEGMYYWAGSENTYFWVDPHEQLIGLFLTQLRPFGHLDLMDQYETLVYQAIED